MVIASENWFLSRSEQANWDSVSEYTAQFWSERSVPIRTELEISDHFIGHLAEKYSNLFPLRTAWCNHGITTRASHDYCGWLFGYMSLISIVTFSLDTLTFYLDYLLSKELYFGHIHSLVLKWVFPIHRRIGFHFFLNIYHGRHYLTE